jgi:hypothetical protein
MLNIIACLLKARTVEPEGTAVAREMQSKHVSAVTNTYEIIEKQPSETE